MAFHNVVIHVKVLADPFNGPKGLCKHHRYHTLTGWPVVRWEISTGEVKEDVLIFISSVGAIQKVLHNLHLEVPHKP